MESELTKLRRKRSRIHRQLDRLEPLLADYQAKLADTEARIHALAPELWLQSRHRRPNPIFGHGELTRFALDVMREAGEPLAVAVIAVRMLARKGIALPDPRLRCRTRERLRRMFASLQERGVTVRVGHGNASRRGIAP